jgi:hypothetical protein
LVTRNCSATRLILPPVIHSITLIATRQNSGEVRSLVAIGGRADMALKAHFGRDWPNADFLHCETM